MKKIILLSVTGFFIAGSFAQSVGIGTLNPRRSARLHILGANTDTSFAAFIDGNVLGVGLQVPRGAVGIGPFLPISRLFVATDTLGTGIDGFAAMVGYSRSDTAAYYGGVYGSYDQSLYGVGVQGIGYNGIDYVTFYGYDAIDVGVHGSADIGVSGIGNVFGVYAEGADLAAEPPTEQYGIYASTANGTAATKYAGYFDGNVNIVGTLSKGAGTFKIDNPLDPANKYLYHSFVESPDMMNIYNGNATTDDNGIAIVTLPNYFDALNKDFRYQLTSIGTFAQAIVKEEISGNYFKIQTSQPNVKVSWQVTGVRKDKYAEAHRVQAEVEKEPWNKGLYLHAKEFGLDKTQSIPWRASLKLVPSATVQNAGLKLQKPRATSRQPMIEKLTRIPVSE